MSGFKLENGDCKVIEQACPYSDRENYKENCYHCLLYNAAELIIERAREKQEKERQHDKEVNTTVCQTV